MPHIHKQYDYVVSIFIVNSDSVLFALHKRYGKWLPIGGHIELDEDPEMAIYREAKEETGLDIKLIGIRPDFNVPGVKSLITPAFMNVHQTTPDHKHISLMYIATTKSAKFIVSDEHVELRWIREDELTDPQYALEESLILYASESLERARSEVSRKV